MTLTAAEHSTLQRLFAAIDARDAAAFVGFLAADAQFRFGAAPAVSGREAIAAAVTAFFESIAGLEHRVDMAMRDGDTLVCEGEVTYTRHDGSEVSLPFADVFEMQGEQIAAYKIYMDIGPLYAG